jgi:uncharacterized protein YndB with AHSA1/START domain
MTEQRILGALRPIDADKGAVRVHDLYATDLEDLWSALTEPERLSRWIADVEGDLSLGGMFNARFTSSWEGPGRVDVCEPPHRLLLTLSPGQHDETVIEALLSAEDGGTRLVVEERGLPIAALASHGAGWQAHLEDLTALVSGRDRADWRSRWSELTPSYRELAEVQLGAR